MENKIKPLLFWLVFVLMISPVIQKHFVVFAPAKLNGEYKEAENPPFLPGKWWDGSFQIKKDNYFNDQCGFRANMVKLNNQLDFWLFKKLHATDVVLGQHQNLYLKAYIDAYFGKDFVGNAKAVSILTKLKAIQDTLAHLGKTLILAYAPGKAYFYPSDFPENLQGPAVAPSNYETYLRIADSLKINQVDFNAWFVSMSGNSKDLLYARQGNHWTTYGSLLAADSLTKYIEKKRNIQLPHIALSNVNTSSGARDKDDDLYKLLNLSYPIVSENFTYPDVNYVSDTTKSKPAAIYIGDSFVFTLLHDDYMHQTNSNWEVWYYFATVINQDEWRSIEGYDWAGNMKKADYLVLLYSPHNLSKLGNGFIENAYDYFYPATK